MQPLIEYFDTVYVINLVDRKDRLKAAMAEFARVGWDRNRSRVQIYPAQKFEDRGGFPSAGARGAYFSHWACLQRALSQGCRNVLIMEDDIALSPALSQLTPSIIAWLNSHEWDFLYFGHYKTGPIPNASAKTQSADLKILPWASEIIGLHFYAINGRIFKSLNAHLERGCGALEVSRGNGPMPVDGSVNVFRLANAGVQTFIVEPKLGWQRPSRSDIMPGALDRLRIMRPLTMAFRKIKYATTRAGLNLK